MPLSSLMIIYFMIIYLFTIKFKKFLMVLISIEMMMMTTSMIMLICLKNINSDFMIIYLLVFMVTESVLGLSLLIMMSRINKNDSMSTMQMLW